MARRLMAIPLALAVVLGAQSVTFAQTRAEAAIETRATMRIADLPAGHWATNATQVAVANNILALQNGQFHGQEDLTQRELRQALESMVNVAEDIAGKGALTQLRAAIGPIPSTDSPVSRLEVAQALSRFLNAAADQQLVAMGTPVTSASRFKDLGTSPARAIQTVVDTYGVMTGYPDATFRPQEEVTRFQMAAIALQTLERMRQAPIAQQPVEEPTPITVEPQAPTIVVVPPEQPEEPEIVELPVETERPDFRSRVPVHLSWQALNATNLQPGTPAFNVIPVQGTFTGYTGPVMLQNVTNFRYDLYQSNLLDSEFRLGYSELKAGPIQLIPYVAANLGVGASIPQNATQYDTYAGAGYGAVLSLLPMNNLEIHGSFGQNFLLGAGRWNSSFQPLGYPAAMGAVLSNYGVGADFYVSPNIALTLGVNTWQLPANLRSASDLTFGGVDNVYGGNIGVGFSF